VANSGGLGGATSTWPRIRFHDPRHTWASLALQAGIPPNVVQELMGHASIAITLETYPHVTPAIKEDATRLVADLISGQ
jgi:integrase